MPLYSLSYDLRTHKDYPRITKELEAEFGAVRVLQSVWCFERHGTTATELAGHFRDFIDHDDQLVVFEVADWASVGVKVPMPE